LVAHTARGVLVDLRPGDIGEVQALPGVDHGLGPAVQLTSIQPAEQHRHGERGHLLIGNLVCGIRGDQPVDLRITQLAAVALGADQVYCVECRRLCRNVRGAHAPKYACSIAPLGKPRSICWLARLAAMFAWEPPSSSHPTKPPWRRISSVQE